MAVAIADHAGRRSFRLNLEWLQLVEKRSRRQAKRRHAMAAPSSTAPKTLSWKVGGMDCASCATKIRGAVERLPGVSDVKLSVMSETLTLSLDAGQTTADAIEKRVNGLGYSTAALTKAPPRSRPVPMTRRPLPVWYQRAPSGVSSWTWPGRPWPWSFAAAALAGFGAWSWPA